MAIDTDYKQLPPGNVENIVVLIHGYGADGKDLIDLAGAWQEALPNTLFAAPNAPRVCEQNPFGYQWFSLLSWDEDRMVRGLEAAAEELFPYLEALIETYQVPASKVVLMGFSQGAMLALHAGLYGPYTFAGIMAYSGAYFKTGAHPIQIPPILLIHGDRDLVVPLSGSLQAEDAIKEMGGSVTLHIAQGIGHGIDEKSIQIGQEFLQKNLSHETIKNGTL